MAIRIVDDTYTDGKDFPNGSELYIEGVQVGFVEIQGEVIWLFAEPPIKPTNFFASDSVIAEVTCTWDVVADVTYELFRAGASVANNVSSPYVDNFVGTADYFIRGHNADGFADSDPDSGTGLPQPFTSPLIITSSGSYTAGSHFPSDTLINIQCMGGGGGGGMNNGTWHGLGGGASSVTIGSGSFSNSATITATVGAGGAGGDGTYTAPNPGGNGGTSNFSTTSSNGGIGGKYEAGGDSTGASSAWGTGGTGGDNGSATAGGVGAGGGGNGGGSISGTGAAGGRGEIRLTW